MTAEGHTTFWIQSNNFEKFEVVCWRDSSEGNVDVKTGPGTTNGGVNTGLAIVYSLSPNELYRYSIMEIGDHTHDQKQIEETIISERPWKAYPSFRTISGELEKYHFAFGSCYKPLEHPQSRTFESLLTETQERRGQGIEQRAR